jgi:antitoxin component of MazEF toxin-antitoxin module
VTERHRRKRAVRKAEREAGIPDFDLESLIARMRPETFHDDIDFGKPVGREIW